MARVLVVEDDVQLRENICEQLELNNHQVRSASNGVQAFELLPGFSPNLILCDIMMPQMDGITFIRAVKRHICYRSIPIIFLTAKVAQQDMIQGLEEGAVDYLFKPFLHKELLLKINNLTNLRTEFLLQQSAQSAVGNETEIQFVKSFTEQLERHLDDASLTAECMAQTMNMSLSALQRNLKKYLDRSFSEILRDYRLRRATAFLVRTDLSLQQIASRCGFSSLSYFSFCFKEVNGQSPLRYRQKHQLRANPD
ncbi:response regulator [Spirosoma taeanense]|uniref:Response regulator n=1 Tax=Spirosoma taeanense TaxID=2735870 RepID=A0A6M5Y7V6_9BACT|nr:response regulator [Spirosoma taeanense]QJW89989.1 response regulator [Spirosoma taeanense]